MKNRKRLWILFSLIAIVAIALHFWTAQKRQLASSADSQSLTAQSAQIKTDMIKSIQWTEQSDQFLFRIESSDPSFCENWKTARISVAAEGVGVSGEAPGAEVSVNCVQGRFEFVWPKRVASWSEPIRKTGDYIEVPTQFFVSAIELTGAAGPMKISSYEIALIRGQSFVLGTLAESQ
jgi:hypothetical protein